MTARFAFGAALLLFVFAAAAGVSSDLSEAQGHQLAEKIIANVEQQPAENVTNTGTLIIDNGKGHRSKIPIQFRTTKGPESWSTTFETTGGSNHVALVVIHKPDKPDEYELYDGFQKPPQRLNGNQTMIPFAGSDFWAVDLTLEFFHWPEQKILKPYEMRRGRSCKVLESINPDPPSYGYSRVVSWIDNETLGIVQAQAYGANGKLLKEFYPKDFKKVNGQWEVGEMEMIDDQTGSRSWIKFNLGRR